MKIVNKRALHNYTVIEKFETGINLFGSEVKSIKTGHINLRGSFVKITGSEAYLINADVSLYEFARPEGYDSKRTRKLLLHKKQIIALKTKLDQGGYSLIPVSVYIKGPLIKVEIALGKGKKKHEKREKIKRRDIEREVEREFRKKLK